MGAANSQREKIVFYVKCRPRGHNLWALAESYRKVFIGYPPWNRGIPDHVQRSEWPHTIQDISSADFDDSKVRDVSWKPRITANRNLSRRIGEGSIVLVPRPADGVCHAGHISGPFEISSEPAYIDAALRYINDDYKSDLDLWGDVTQTWPVERWVDVPFAFLPGWTRYRLLSQNTIGEVKHLDALAVMESLLANPAKMPTDWTRTNDPETVLDRMSFYLTPSAFEHLAVELLQLEYPTGHWLHVGGSGDGGVDGICVENDGSVRCTLQCKWSLPDQPIERPSLVRPDVRHYIASLSRSPWKHAPKHSEMLYGLDIAAMLIQHAENVPAAKTLGVSIRG